MGLGGVELVMAVEDAFGIQIDDEQAQQIITVEDLFKTVLHQIEHDPIDEEQRVCRRCRYCLRGLRSDRCPECGEEFIPYDQASATRVWRHLTGVIAEQAATERERIKPHTRLVRDLGLD